MASSPVSRTSGILIADRFRIERKLGSGSLGAVYLAQDLTASRLVALKLLRPEQLDPQGLARLKREFRAIATLHHPHIASAYDFGYAGEDRRPFYTREYIEGTPLSAGPPGAAPHPSPREFLAPILDVLAALAYLHAHDILHLDVHSANVIVPGCRT